MNAHFESINRMHWSSFLIRKWRWNYFYSGKFKKIEMLKTIEQNCISKRLINNFKSLLLVIASAQKSYCSGQGSLIGLLAQRSASSINVILTISYGGVVRDPNSVDDSLIKKIIVWIVANWLITMLEQKIKDELVKLSSVHQIVAKHFLDPERHLVSLSMTAQVLVTDNDFYQYLVTNIAST